MPENSMQRQIRRQRQSSATFPAKDQLASLEKEGRQRWEQMQAEEKRQEALRPTPTKRIIRDFQDWCVRNGIMTTDSGPVELDQRELPYPHNPDARRPAGTYLATVKVPCPADTSSVGMVIANNAKPDYNRIRALIAAFVATTGFDWDYPDNYQELKEDVPIKLPAMINPRPKSKWQRILGR